MVQSNSLLYNIVSDNQLASILSYFDPDYIYNIVTNSLRYKFRPYNPPLPNLVNSLEMDYKATFENYPETEETKQSRFAAYTNIIKIICDTHDIDYNLENVDIYSAASTIYDLLISNFSNNIINFFTNYIIKERNSLYNGLNLATLKKNKDSTTIYNKKIFYKSIKIATINANLELILDSMKVFDITFEDILSFIYPKEICNFITSIFLPKSDFYKNVFVPIIEISEYRVILLTAIRLNLQSNYADIQDIDIKGGFYNE